MCSARNVLRTTYAAVLRIYWWATMVLFVYGCQLDAILSRVGRLCKCVSLYNSGQVCNVLEGRWPLQELQTWPLVGTFFECSDCMYLGVKRLWPVGITLQTSVTEAFIVWRGVHNQDFNGYCTFASLSIVVPDACCYVNTPQKEAIDVPLCPRSSVGTHTRAHNHSIISCQCSLFVYMLRAQ